MSDYSKITNFTAKDALSSGDPNKVVKGSEHDAEYTAISTAIATKYDSADLASQAVAEAASSNTTLMTPLRVAQLIAASSTIGLLAGTQTFTGNKTFSGTFVVSGGATFSSTIALNGAATFSSTIDLGDSALNGGSCSLTTDNDTADELGFKGMPQNTQNGNYTLVLADAGKHIYKASGGAGETITVPANASVAYPVGTVITVVNQGGGALSIAITSDTLTLAVSGDTGTRTLADDGVATLLKVGSTSWIISGAGLS